MSGYAGRDSDGSHTSSPSDDDLLSCFETGRPFRTTEEVADRFDVDPATARRRLRRLVDVSWVESHSLGDTTVWWRDRETVGTTQPDDDPLFDAPAFDADEPVDGSAVDTTLYGDRNL